MTAQPLFPAWFNPHRKTARPNTTKLFAVFPDGTESEIVSRKSPASGSTKDFACKRPDGTTESNGVMRDLRLYLEQDYPGTRFERRKP